MNNVKIFLVSLAVWGLSAGAVQAQIIVIDSGYCGMQDNNLTWILTNDSTLVISGNGEMADYYNKTTPWNYSYRTKIKTVVIGDSITTIGNWAFRWCNNLNSLTIGNSVKSIGDRAFDDCNNLTSVTIPNSVTRVESEAFKHCSSLISVIIPDSVTRIGNGVFVGCSSLTSVIIGKNIKNIGYEAFIDCKNLSSITIYAKNPPTLGSNSFYNVPVNIPVYVPCGSIPAYQVSWGYFTNYQDTISVKYSDYIIITQQDNTFVIDWQNIGATNYEIHRNNILLATGSTTTYTDTNLAHGTNYCYQIKAIHENCESLLSDAICQTFSNVGIVETHCNASLRIYPNPVKGELTISPAGGGKGVEELTIENIEIYDVLGQCVFTTPNPSKGGEYSTSAQFPSFGGVPEGRGGNFGEAGVVIDVSHLSAGMYFLKIDNKVVKFVKE